MAFEEMKFKAGDWVIKQGDDGDFFYICEDGNLDCFKKYPTKEKPIKVF